MDMIWKMEPVAIGFLASMSWLPTSVQLQDSSVPRDKRNGSGDERAVIH